MEQRQQYIKLNNQFNIDKLNLAKSLYHFLTSNSFNSSAQSLSAQLSYKSSYKQSNQQYHKQLLHNHHNQHKQSSQYSNDLFSLLDSYQKNITDQQKYNQINHKTQQNPQNSILVHQNAKNNIFTDETINNNQLYNQLNLLFNVKFHQKKTHIIPNQLILSLQFNNKIILTQPSPNFTHIAAISISNQIKIIQLSKPIKLIHSKKLSQLQSQNQITSLKWINKSLFAISNSKGQILVYKINLQLHKKFISHSSSSLITNLQTYDNLIYAIGKNKLTISNIQNGVFKQYVIPQLTSIIKLKKAQSIVGISNNKKQVYIYDMKIRQYGKIVSLKQGKIKQIYLTKNQTSIIVIIYRNNNSYLQQYSLIGQKIKTIILKHTDKSNQIDYEVKSISPIKQNLELWAHSFINSTKINFLSLLSGNKIYQLQCQTEEQLINKQQGITIKYVGQDVFMIINKLFLRLYSCNKNEQCLKIIAKKRKKIPSQLAMFIRTLRQRHPQTLNIQLFEQLINNGNDSQLQQEENQVVQMQQIEEQLQQAVVYNQQLQRQQLQDQQLNNVM